MSEASLHKKRKRKPKAAQSLSQEKAAMPLTGHKSLQLDSGSELRKIPEDVPSIAVRPQGAKPLARASIERVSDLPRQAGSHGVSPKSHRPGASASWNEALRA